MFKKEKFRPVLSETSCNRTDFVLTASPTVTVWPPWGTRLPHYVLRIRDHNTWRSLLWRYVDAQQGSVTLVLQLRGWVPKKTSFKALTWCYRTHRGHLVLKKVLFPPFRTYLCSYLTTTCCQALGLIGLTKVITSWGQIRSGWGTAVSSSVLVTMLASKRHG